ncbi:NTP transferase domain-containing protein [Hyphobacterium sp. CCMP332]|uniref:cytidylyltransferase domain-containing protein n=1 Tax=Hyphobacterium sp. CCMP332 TaxID=2749086 RepID=UPI00164F7578|nr:NTP transferase domain-containing protein [Hyphobacterium sp. CCMP332]QNL18361.1 NTP transferase domain-containing protein [Hyphobacterium sp. CCMP332]
MSLAVIVQARAASSRIPLKLLESLGERSALLRCMDRCREIDGAELVIAAVADGPGDDEIAEEASDAGYMVTRGPEEDVLARMAAAARDSGAETILRVEGHHPFIDPQICHRVVQLLDDTHADFACNDMPLRFPNGLQCEAFPVHLLHEAERNATKPFDRQSVTGWIRTHPRIRRVALTGPGQGLENLRWTLEEPEDLDFCAAVYAELGDRAASIGAAELAALCLRRPDIAGLNAGLNAAVPVIGTPEFATPPMAFRVAA